MLTEQDDRGRGAQGKHTPGPWEVRHDDAEKVEANDGEGVAVMSGGHRGTVERAANARLIAAAPELLAALRIIAEWDPAASPNEPGGMSIMDAIDIAQAAIRKAEGGAA